MPLYTNYTRATGAGGGFYATARVISTAKDGDGGQDGVGTIEEEAVITVTAAGDEPVILMSHESRPVSASRKLREQSHGRRSIGSDCA